jgi:hypothetical protein
VFLEGQITRQDSLSRQSHGPRAVLNAVERIANGYGAECDRLRQDLTIAETQLKDYRARQGQPFPHEEYLLKLTCLRDQLKAGLSAAQPQEGQPSVSELADQIKSLKSAHSIEAAPERTGKRKAVGERPVTNRIRRPTESLPALAPGTETIAFQAIASAETGPLAHADPQLTVPDSESRAAEAERPAVSYRDRLAGRLPKQYQRRLF